MPARPGASGGRDESWRLAVLLGVLLLATLATPGGATGQEEPPAPAVAGDAGRGASLPVTRVELRSDSQLDDPEALARLITLTPGEPWSERLAQGSLRNLQAAGVAGDIELFRRPEPPGVAAIFALWSYVRVDRVDLEGELGVKKAQLARALTIAAGQPLLEDRVIRTLYRLQDLYREQGYLDAVVRVGVEVDEQRKRARVAYRVSSGAPAMVGQVTFDGELGEVAPADLVAQLKAAPGQRYRAGTVKGDAERLGTWLVRAGYRRARVEPAREDYDRDARLVALVYPVELGPRFEVRVQGASLPELTKKDLLPFLQDEGFDESLMLQSVEALRTYYQRQGYYDVKVDWRQERDDGRVVIFLDIVPGQLYSLARVVFSGNEEVAEKDLRQLLATSERRLLATGSGRLVDSVLAEDLANIRSYYALQGYSQAEVGPPRVERREGDRLELTVPIREGPRKRVVDVVFEGVESVAPSVLEAGLPLAPRGPFHPQLLEDTLALLRSRYEEEGFDAAQISADLDWNPEHTLVDVTVRVLEGPRARVDRIIVRGNRRTRAAAVERWVDLQPGDPLSTRRMLEVQRSLYRLGVFSRVEVTERGGSPFASERNVLVRLEEGRARRLFYGLGYDSEDGVRGLLGFTHANLFGRAYSYQLDLRLSQRQNQFRSLLRQPYVGRWPVAVDYSLFRVEERQDSFDSSRTGLQVEASRVYGDLRVGLKTGYRRVVLSNVDPNLSELEIDRNLQNVEIASVTPNFLLDHRDDPVDPTRGWSSQLQLEHAFPLANADTRFLKLFAQQTGYVSLGRAGLLAASARLGGIEPLGGSGFEDPTLPSDLPSRLVPISERFFAGGRTTHRAYRRDRLGIDGESLIDGAAVGGNGLLLANLDYRFPIAGPVGGTVFFDTGNVWADWRNIDPRQVKSGIGLGFRFASPVGPLRIEAGWKLDREAGEDPWVVFLSFGNPF